MSTAIAKRSSPTLSKDGLDTYMAEVKRIPLLTREQEFELATQWQNNKDITAAHRLVTGNLRFVVKVAMEYRSQGARVLDLVQEGNVGLMHAVQKFDPDRGYRLITYAVWWIRAYIQTYLLKAWSLVKLGTAQAQRRLFFKLPQARAQLEQKAGRELGATERHEAIAEALGVKPKEVSQMEVRMAARDFSLDLTLDDAGDTSHMDLLVDDHEGADAVVATEQIKERLAGDLRAALETLNDREREVIELRYLQDDRPTLKEIGASWGVSRERARQIEAQGRKKLQKWLIEHSEVLSEALPEVVDVARSA